MEDYRREENEIDGKTLSRVENDLKRYPDWIVRLETGGLGIPSRALVVQNRGLSIGSLVERDAELSDEIKKKVIAIEKVYDRLHGRMKDLIDYKYFQGYGRDEVIQMLNISKRTYYNLRNRALESFARALSYIE